MCLSITYVSWHFHFISWILKMCLALAWTLAIAQSSAPSICGDASEVCEVQIGHEQDLAGTAKTQKVVRKRNLVFSLKTSCFQADPTFLSGLEGQGICIYICIHIFTDWSSFQKCSKKKIHTPFWMMNTSWLIYQEVLYVDFQRNKIRHLPWQSCGWWEVDTTQLSRIQSLTKSSALKKIW